MKRWGSVRTGMALGVWLGAAGCAPTLEEWAREQRVVRLQAENRALAKRVESMETELRAGLSLALCRPEIRQLLADVKHECDAPIAADTVAMCTTRKIHPAVVTADPQHRGRFLRLMNSLRHETFYMRHGQGEIIKTRRVRLENLARAGLLHNTLYLIVSHPAPTEKNPEVEAMARAEVISNLLRSFEVPEERIRRWVYAFPVRAEEIEQAEDRPILGEPTDVNRSVWVFRADC